MRTPAHRPSFFIIGAPKCGTTALANYLADHREILFSVPKEPTFFSTDIKNKTVWAQNEADYLRRCFGHGGDRSYQAIGEGSVWYLFSHEAVPNILAFEPEARFIVMLRNPADLIHSLHSQYVIQGHERFSRLREAWVACDARRAGRYSPETWKDPRLMLYDEIGLLGAQLDRVMRHVGSNRLKVILMEDFAQDARGVYEATLDFLSVDQDGRSEFPRDNRSLYIDNPLILALLRSKPAGWVATVLRALLGRHSLGIGRPAAQFDPADRTMLLAYFRADIDRLSGLIGRDLSHWYYD